MKSVVSLFINVLKFHKSARIRSSTYERKPYKNNTAKQVYFNRFSLRKIVDILLWELIEGFFSFSIWVSFVVVVWVRYAALSPPPAGVSREKRFETSQTQLRKRVAPPLIGRNTIFSRKVSSTIFKDDQLDAFKRKIARLADAFWQNLVSVSHKKVISFDSRDNQLQLIQNKFSDR